MSQKKSNFNYMHNTDFYQKAMRRILLCIIMIYEVVGLHGVGVLTSINERFIESEVSRLFSTLEKDLIAMDPIPQISKRSNKLYYSMSEIIFTKFSAPIVDIEMSGPALTLVTNLKDADISLSLDWYASYETWFRTFSISGSASVRLYGVHLTKQVTIGIDNMGRLNIKPCEECCGISIDTIDITIHGGYISWIINKFIGYFDTMIEKVISEESCYKLNSLTTNEANDLIRSTPNNWLLNNGMEVNYKPVFVKGDGNCVQIGVTGVIGLKGEKIKFEESQIKEGCAPNGKSFSFRLSQQSVQTFFTTLYKKGSLDYRLEKSKGSSRVFIVKEGANPLTGQEPLNIDIEATSAPQVNITHQGIKLKIPVLLKVTLKKTHSEMKSKIMLGPRGHNKHVIKVTADLTCDLGLSLNNTEKRLRLTGSISNPSVAVSELLSKKTIYTKKHATDYLFSLLQKTLVPITNIYLEEGVPVYLSSRFTLNSSTLKYYNDYIEVVGDIERR